MREAEPGSENGSVSPRDLPIPAQNVNVLMPSDRRDWIPGKTRKVSAALLISRRVTIPTGLACDDLRRSIDLPETLLMEREGCPSPQENLPKILSC